MRIPDNFMPIRKASEITGLSRSFIRHIARLERIECVMVGNMYLVNVNDLLEENYVRDHSRRNYRRGNKKQD